MCKQMKGRKRRKPLKDEFQPFISPYSDSILYKCARREIISTL